MGQLINGINGHIQGKIGTVIGSSWKGKPYVKGPYKKRTGKAGKGEAGNRNKFAEAQFWLKPLLKFVREGFNGYAERVEGFCAAKSHLLLNAFEGLQPEIGNAKDQVMMLAYDVAHAKAYFTTLGQFRKDGADVLHTDPTPGRTYHIYCAFSAADRSRQSHSVYLDVVTM